MTIFSPLEQFSLFPIISMIFTLSNIGFTLLYISCIIFLINRINQNNLVSANNWNIFKESTYDSIYTIILNFSSHLYVIYMPLFYSLFYKILFSNLIGLIPYSSTPTVEIIMTLFLAFSLLGGILMLGFLTHKIFLFSMFLPNGTPLFLVPLMIFLELLAYLNRTISLGLRLSINLITGHVLIKICIGFLWAGSIKSISKFILVVPLI